MIKNFLMRYIFPMSINLFILGFILNVNACKNNIPEKNNGLQEVHVDANHKNSEIIRMPISAQASADTINIARIQIEEPIYNFGETKKGTAVKHTFKFKNIGKAPLYIVDVRTTCGCTVPSWSKKIIEPNACDELAVQFNTENATDKQVKKITIIANTYPAETVMTMIGIVKTEK